MSTVEVYSPGHADSDLHRYLQFDYPVVSPEKIVARQQPTLCSCDGIGSGRVDARALLAVTDHVMGLALHAALDHKGPLATVDLKIEHLKAIAPGDVFIRVLTGPITSVLGYVVARLDQGDPNFPVAEASARFMIGAWPGGGAADFPPPLGTQVDMSGISDFSSFAGLPRHDGESVSFAVEARERVVGARAVPAFHGGIVAAALQTAASNLAVKERGAGAVLVNLAIDYARAAVATEPLMVDAKVLRGGRRTLRIRAWCRQGDRVVTEAQALFLIP